MLMFMYNDGGSFRAYRVLMFIYSNGESFGAYRVLMSCIVMEGHLECIGC